ncbi:hypothetical protein ACFQMM_14805 [Saliphagus sp. GCM10025308]
MEVRDYTIRRLIIFVPTMLLITVMTFGLTRIAGTPITMYASRFSSQEQIEQIREMYHLNDPIWVQYYYWLTGVLQGDLGWSSTAASRFSTRLPPGPQRASSWPSSESSLRSLSV